jgi:hypothetical protein
MMPLLSCTSLTYFVQTLQPTKERWNAHEFLRFPLCCPCYSTTTTTSTPFLYYTTQWRLRTDRRDPTVDGRAHIRDHQRRWAEYHVDLVDIGHCLWPGLSQFRLFRLLALPVRRAAHRPCVPIHGHLFRGPHRVGRTAHTAKPARLLCVSVGRRANNDRW